MKSIDLGFAIAATGAQADKNFQKMKDILTAIVDGYGNEDIHYAGVVFGRTTRRRLSFNDEFSKPEDVKTFISSFPRISGGPDLSKALEEGRKLFGVGEGARPDAKQVFLLVTDKKSTSLSEDVAEAAKLFTDSNIHVIAVALGSEADSKELEKATPTTRDVIAALEQHTPEFLAQRIVNLALEGEKHFYLLLVLSNLFLHSSLSENPSIGFKPINSALPGLCPY